MSVTVGVVLLLFSLEGEVYLLPYCENISSSPLT